MDRVHGPDESGKKGRRRQSGLAYFLAKKGDQQTTEEEVKKNAAGRVKKHIGKVKPVSVIAPEEVVEDERNILDGAVMGRVGIEEEIMAKRFENKKAGS